MTRFKYCLAAADSLLFLCEDWQLVPLLLLILSRVKWTPPGPNTQDSVGQNSLCSYEHMERPWGDRWLAPCPLLALWEPWLPQHLLHMDKLTKQNLNEGRFITGSPPRHSVKVGRRQSQLSMHA